MCSVSEAPLWQKCRTLRQGQRRVGLISSILLVATLLTLADGLLASMRTGSDVLDLLPGEALMLSGPTPVKNPVPNDVVPAFTPPEAPLHFVLEGFFAGYWFGSSMWRGKVEAENQAEPGSYALRLNFRGAANVSAQKFTLRVWADPAALRAGSASFFYRLSGYNPFVAAAGFGLTALLLALGTYSLGRAYFKALAALRCAQVYRLRPEATGVILLCALAGQKAPRLGQVCTLLNPEGQAVGQAAVATVNRGVLEMRLAGHGPAAQATAASLFPGCLVRLQPAATATPPASDPGRA